MVTATVALERLLNCLLIVVVLVGGEIRTPKQNAKSWSMEHELQGNCLLLEPMVFQGAGETSVDSVANVANSSSDPLAGSREVLDSIARQITYGIVSGNDAAGSVIHNHHSSVDLTVFIANDVDNRWMSQDGYWQYYIHCDQWGVVLSESLDVDFQGLAVDEADSGDSLIEIGAGVYSMASQWIGEQIRKYEFVCIEQMAEMHNVPKSCVFADVEEAFGSEDSESTHTPATSINMLGIVQRELAGRWAPVTQLFERLAEQNPMIPVDHLLDDWLFDPFLELPYDVVLIESELDELH